MEIALDLRTLAFNNLITGIVFGIGMLLYANVNKTLLALKHQGAGFILLSVGFLLLGMRDVVHEFVTVILANSFVALGFYYTCESVLRFLDINRVNFNRTCATLFLLLLVSFIYYTYEVPNINYRICVISLFVSFLSFYLFYSIRSVITTYGQKFFIAIKYIFLIMGLLFLSRGVFSAFEHRINDFMNASTWHGLSFIAFELMFIIIALSTTGLANARLSKDLEMQATLDPLTGLNNRRSLNRVAESELNRCKRNGCSFSLMLIDIDYFKLINDNYGHQVGDEVLIEFSKWLSTKVRASDFVARFGGEEFVVLLNDIDSELLIRIANEIRQKISEKKFQANHKVSFSINISIGVASSEESGLEWSELLSKADKRLYKAKSKGRNQVVWR